MRDLVIRKEGRQNLSTTSPLLRFLVHCNEVQVSSGEQQAELYLFLPGT